MKTLLCTAFIILNFASCSPVVYIPTTQHVPSLKEKGDVSTEAFYSYSHDTDGLGFSLANATSDKDGIGFSTNYVWDNYGENSGNGGYLEAFYLRYGNIGDHQKFVWTLTSGLGHGWSKWDESDGSDFLNSKFTKFFAQPSIGYSSVNVDILASTRIAFLTFGDPEFSFHDEFDRRRALDFFSEKDNTIVLEPALTFRIGGESFKIYFQYVFTSFSYDTEYEPYNKDMIALGVHVNID